MCILNGRTDQHNKVEKATKAYSTVIDYVIGSLHLFTRSKNYKVMDFDPLLSDVHCGIQLQLQVKDNMDKVKCMPHTHIHKVNRGKPGKGKNY